MAASTFSVVSPRITKSFPKPKTTYKSFQSIHVYPSMLHPTTQDVKLQRTIRASHESDKSVNTSRLDDDISEAKGAPLKTAIIGFGKFGQFMAEGLRRQGHEVLATSRSDYSEYCKKNGIKFYKSIDEMCKEQPDIVLICCSIISVEAVVRSIPFHKLKQDTIFVDVLSVKEFPKKLFLEVLPPEFGIVCTHPMFGPESGKNGWARLPFVYENVRVYLGEQATKCAQFLSVFEQEGCRMVEMSCEEHDRLAASSQFITHTIGRVLSHLNLESNTISTKGYETLLQLTENTVSDSFDLYYGLFMYNVNAIEQLDNLERAFAAVKQDLFDRLQDLLGKQIVERDPVEGAANDLTEAKITTYLQQREQIKDTASLEVNLEDHKKFD